ncbi:MAG: hypothetical protein K0R92_2877 [Lachnospiraceae bacterium]|jgi:hypothetical protein|nr:hypothetical protein [Lachnospiraceae bacterium]
MLTIFQVCFLAGTGLIIISLVFGNLLEFSGIEGFDLELPISPILFVLFVTVFGGVGWLLTECFLFIPVILSIIAAAITGIFICYFVNHLVILPLKRAQNTSTPDAEELLGVKATVTETIAIGGYGEISYVINGNSYTSPAKATNNSEIKAGKEVAICWIEEHVFYVIGIDI